jgi:hypothetical protein
MRQGIEEIKTKQKLGKGFLDWYKHYLIHEVKKSK